MSSINILNMRSVFSSLSARRKKEQDKGATLMEVLLVVSVSWPTTCGAAAPWSRATASSTPTGTTSTSTAANKKERIWHPV